MDYTYQENYSNIGVVLQLMKIRSRRRNRTLWDTRLCIRLLEMPQLYVQHFNQLQNDPTSFV